MENIKAWVMNETPRFSIEDHNCKHDLPRNEASDAEILKTYSTGLLAVCLAGSAPILMFLFLVFPVLMWLML